MLQYEWQWQLHVDQYYFMTGTALSVEAIDALMQIRVHADQRSWTREAVHEQGYGRSFAYPVTNVHEWVPRMQLSGTRD